MRKALAIALVLIAPTATLAQRVNHSTGGCGPSNTNFTVKAATGNGPGPAPASGKALVYVAQVMENGPRQGQDDATTRVGVDGTWVGANHGNTYFYFSVDPGPHSVCVDWQSTLLARSKLAAAASLDARAGSTYYFQVRTQDPAGDDPGYVKLKLVDASEGRLLLGSSSGITFTAKK